VASEICYNIMKCYVSSSFLFRDGIFGLKLVIVIVDYFTLDWPLDQGLEARGNFVLGDKNKKDTKKTTESELNNVM